MDTLRNYLDGWVIIYNVHAQLYMAAERDNINDLWNDFSSPKVVKADSYSTLEAIIIKGEGSLDKINQIVKS